MIVVALKILDEIKRIMQETPAMIRLETEDPPDVQICTVAVVDRSGDLFAYYKSVEWMSRVRDWRFLRNGTEIWLIKLVESIADGSGDELTFLWKPAPQPCDRP